MSRGLFSFSSTNIDLKLIFCGVLGMTSWVLFSIMETNRIPPTAMIPAAIMYKRDRTLKGALKGLLVGIVAMVAVGALANYFIMIPFYVNVMNMPLETILSMIAQVVPPVDTLPRLILLATSPFNLLKGAVLAVVTCLLYKRLSPILKNKN